VAASCHRPSGGFCWSARRQALTITSRPRLPAREAPTCLAAPTSSLEAARTCWTLRERRAQEPVRRAWDQRRRPAVKLPRPVPRPWRAGFQGIFLQHDVGGVLHQQLLPYNAFRGSLTLSALAASAALADVYSQQFLISMAGQYAFTFLIPLGLLFRTFKVSRRAGGALIAIGFGFYAVLPIMVVRLRPAAAGFKPLSVQQPAQDCIRGRTQPPVSMAAKPVSLRSQGPRH